MALKITSIGDRGTLKDERIGFLVISKGNLKYFIVLVVNFNEGGFYNRSNDAFWFTPEEVQTGDRVVLYTGAGTDSFKKNEDGSKTYFKYWGLKTPIFTSEKKGVVIVEANNWALSKYVK